MGRGPADQHSLDRDMGSMGDVAPLRLRISVLRGNIYILAGKAENNIQMYLLSSDWQDYY